MSPAEEIVLPPVVYTVSLTRMVALRLAMYGTVLLYVALAVVFSVHDDTYALPSLGNLGLIGLLGLGAAIATLIVHEAIHGGFFRLFGGRPRFGVGCIGGFMPYAYATVPGMPFTRRQMTIICLAPFVLLSTAAFCALWFVPSIFVIAATAFATNVSGSIGDLWITALLWRFRHCDDLLLVDSRDSMSFHTRDPRGAAIAAAVTAGEAGGIVRQFALRTIAAISAMYFAVMPLGIALSVLNAPDVTLGPAPFPVVVYRTMGGHGLSIELDGVALIVSGVVVGALSLPFRRRRRGVHPEETSHLPRPAFL
jgi:hypothetical protein